MIDICIEVVGGNVVNVHSTESENINIYLIDWDNIESGEEGAVNTPIQLHIIDKEELIEHIEFAEEQRKKYLDE